MKRAIIAVLMLGFLFCACVNKNVRVEGGGTGREMGGAVVIGTDF